MPSPNLHKLLTEFISVEAVPLGVRAPHEAALAYFTDDERRREITASARAKMQRAINAVRNASDPNPWRNATEEEIAGEILQGIEKRRASLAAASRGGRP